MERVLCVVLGYCALVSAAWGQNYEYSGVYQPNLSQIRVTSTLHNTVDGTGFAIGVMDGMADDTHVDLQGKTTTSNLYGGWIEGGDAHGTHVSGIAAASRNDVGIVGVAPGASVYSHAVFDDYGWIPDDEGRAALDAMAAANDSGANIIAVNQSYGCSGTAFCSSAELQMLDDYLDQFLIVRAAGNDGVNVSSLSYDKPDTAAISLGNMLIVGSVDGNNRSSGFSNRPGNATVNGTVCTTTYRKGRPRVSCSRHRYSMRNMFIVAPGENVLSDMPDNQIGYMSGTSMAAPHVTGAAALVAHDAQNKGAPLTPTQIADILKRSATDLGRRGVDGVYGWGLLNVQAALNAVGPIRIATGDSVDGPYQYAGDSTIGPTTGDRVSRAAAGLLHGAMVLDDFNRPFWLKAPEASSIGESYLARVSSRTQAVTGLSSWRDDGDDLGVASWVAEASSGMEVRSPDMHAGLSFGDPLMVASPLAGETGPLRFDQMAFAAYDEGLANHETLASLFVSRDVDGVVALEGFLATSFVEESSDGSGVNLLGLALNRELAGHVSVGVTFNAMHERGSLAGAGSSGAFALGENNFTNGLGVKFQAGLSDKVSFSGFWSRFTTYSDEGGGSLFETSGLGGDQFGLVLSARDLMVKGDGLSLSAIKPMQITDGEIVARVPIARDADGKIIHELRKTALDRENLPLHFSLGYTQRAGAWTRALSLDLIDADAARQGGLGGAVTAAAILQF